jgi:putative oxidoreductase
MSAHSLLLPSLGRFSDVGLLALRVFVGVFLVWGVLDNVVSAERMEEFVRFVRANGFPWPQVMAPFSVYAQLVCGTLLILGLLTRLAGVLMCGHFIIAVLMVHLNQDFRAQWPALILVFLSAYFALNGGGRWALDRLLGDR